jgi:hypothetical protein
MLRRFTNNNGTTILTYPFGIEEHQYSGSGSNQWNVSSYFLAGQLLGSLDGNGTQFYLTDAAGGASLKGNQLFGPYYSTTAVCFCLALRPRCMSKKTSSP